MFNLKKIIQITAVLAVIFSTTGCITIKSSTDKSATDGGIFKTNNKGTLWQQKTLVPTVSGSPKSFAAVDIYSLAIDPSDHKALYYGSVGNGLFYTYDGGENWQIATALGMVTVRAIAVDYNSKCIIYTAVGNKLFKSSDCSRSWKQMYYDNDVNITVDAIAVDHYDSRIVYIGLSRGDVLKSSDQGENWQTIYRPADKINKIIIAPNDSRVIYIITNSKGVFRSNDGGNTWADMNKGILEMNIGINIKEFILFKKEPDKIFLTTSAGILKSGDKGNTWEKINLIVPDAGALINSLAVNPQNTKEIYYVTNTVLYRSLDGGENWKTIKLPTTRAGWQLLPDPEDQNIIYMGVRSLKR